MATSRTVMQEGIYINPAASSYTHQDKDKNTTSTSIYPTTIRSFHTSLPSFNKTPLHDVPALATSLGVHRLLIKSESSRLGLPAFKILGASWGVYRALCTELGLTPDPEVTTLDLLKETVGSSQKQYVLFAATDGNHGRAVARMASIVLPEREVGGRAAIYVPKGMYETTKELIEGEGADVVTVMGDYDAAVTECWDASEELTRSGEGVGVMVQDNAFEGYETVPGWIVEGYATLLAEVDEQYRELVGEDGKQITHVVTPIGVGSLGHAVVKWAKAASRKQKVRVIACEPETAACLHASLRAGRSTTIETIDTIMSGMCCGTVSPTSWEALRDGVDSSVTVGDWECHESVLRLTGEYGIEAGPCGAGCLAGLSKALRSAEAREKLQLNKDSVVVVLSTEGKREYPVPEKL